MSDIKWIPVTTRKPKRKKGFLGIDLKLLNVFWYNELDCGDYLTFGYWSEKNQDWFNFDEERTRVATVNKHLGRIVTHWAEQPASPKHKHAVGRKKVVFK